VKLKEEVEIDTKNWPLAIMGEALACLGGQRFVRGCGV
jgi:hypothetical protein